MKYEKYLREEDLLSSDWVGEVIDNDDPEKSGRCRVRIFGKFDGKGDESDSFLIPDDHIPWAYPSGSNMFAGGEGGAGSLSVPKLGTKVRVRFSGGNIYAPEYVAVQDLNDKLKDELADSYLDSHVVAFDEDEEMKILYTPSKGLEIFHKSSHILINPDSSITIEHKDTKSIIELVGPNINITANSTVNITANSKVELQASECVVNGISSTKLGPASVYSAMLAEPTWVFLKMLAAAIDAKLPSTPGLLTNQAVSFEQLATSKNVKLSI